jgi:hypothetical protein
MKENDGETSNSELTPTLGMHCTSAVADLRRHHRT